MQELQLSHKEFQTKALQEEAIQLLQQLIAIPSISREEDKTAEAIEKFFQEKKIITYRHLNNVWVKNLYFNPKLPTLLLISHHDTVKPNAGYTINPFSPIIKDGKLYGLGSNDAGGSLVSLLACFLFYYNIPQLPYNIIFAATAEEEISGNNGITAILSKLENISFGIVGEPTAMQVAVAERGLIVIDCVANGTSSHAANNNVNNAISNAIKDIEWFHQFQFAKKSNFLEEVKMNVTIINAGTQHNVIPDTCTFTVDVRTNDQYTNEEIFNHIIQHIKSDAKPRSFRLKASSINTNHPIVEAAKSLGLSTFGSSTLSDMALLPFPCIKMGPGLTARSHTSDEFIFIDEIKEGVITYINLLSKLFSNDKKALAKK